MYKDKFCTENLKNMSEELVFKQIHNLIEEGGLDFCQCDICLQDIAAIALNNTPPRYTCSEIDRLMPSPELQEDMQELSMAAQAAVTQAIQKVGQVCHH